MNNFRFWSFLIKLSKIKNIGKFLIHSWLDKAFRITFVNWTCHGGGSLEITSRVHLTIWDYPRPFSLRPAAPDYHKWIYYFKILSMALIVTAYHCFNFFCLFKLNILFCSLWTIPNIGTAIVLFNVLTFQEYFVLQLCTLCIA